MLQEFTKISAVELAPNFRVNGIAPGLILPPEGKDEGYLWNLAENIPLKKIGNLDEINKAVQFIIESEFFTGQTLFIDGGEHLVWKIRLKTGNFFRNNPIQKQNIIWARLQTPSCPQ